MRPEHPERRPKQERRILILHMHAIYVLLAYSNRSISLFINFEFFLQFLFLLLAFYKANTYNSLI